MLYTTAKQEDIKVYGKLVPATEENIVAYASNIYDDLLGMFQTEINSTLDPAGSASTRKDNTWTGKNTFDGDVELNGTIKINALNVPTIGANTLTADDITAKTITVDTLNCDSYAPENIDTTKVTADEATIKTGNITTLTSDEVHTNTIEATTATIDTATINTKLDVKGETTVDDITVGGDATVSGNLTVSGNATLANGFTSEVTTDTGKYTGEYNAKSVYLEDTANSTNATIDASKAKFVSGDNALTAQATSLAVTDGTATNTITSTSSSIASGTDKSELTTTALAFTDSSADPANTLTINKTGITKSGGSDTAVFNTNGGTVDMTEYASLVKANVFTKGGKQTYKSTDEKQQFILNPATPSFYMKYTKDDGNYIEYSLKQDVMYYALREYNTMMRDIIQVEPKRIVMQYGYVDYGGEDVGYRLKMENAPDIKMRLSEAYTLFLNQWTKNNFTLSAAPIKETVSINTRTASIDTSQAAYSGLALSMTDASTKDVYDAKLGAGITPKLTLKKTDANSIEQGSYYVSNTESKWDTALDASGFFPIYCNGSDSAKSLKKGVYNFYDWDEDTPPTNPDAQPGLHTTMEMTGYEITAKQVVIQTGATAPDHSTLTAKFGSLLSDAGDFSGGTGLYVHSDQNDGDGTEQEEYISISYDEFKAYHKKGSTEKYTGTYTAAGMTLKGGVGSQRPINISSHDNKTLVVTYLDEDTTNNIPAHYDVNSNADYINFSAPIQEHVKDSLYTNNIAQDKQVLTTNSDATTKATSLTATSAGLSYYKHIADMEGTPVYNTRESAVDSEQLKMYLLPSQGTTDPDDPEAVAGYKYNLTSTPTGIKHTTSANQGSGYTDTTYVTVGVVNTSAGLDDSVKASLINSSDSSKESYTTLNYDGINIAQDNTVLVSVTPSQIQMLTYNAGMVYGTAKIKAGGASFESLGKSMAISPLGLAAPKTTTGKSMLPKYVIPSCGQTFYEVGTSADSNAIATNISAICPLNTSGNIPSTHPAEAVAPEFIITASDGTKYKFDLTAAREAGIIVEVA